MKPVLILGIAATVLFASCKKEKEIIPEPPSPPVVKSDISVEIDHIAGPTDLYLNTGTCTNTLGETFMVTKLKYYLSNFKFTNVDGTVYAVPKDSCYFLIDESIPASLKSFMRVPIGEYKAVSFIVGVDSLKNTAPISERTGVLDPAGPAADMYWGWNSGYVFFKLEGTSPVISGMGNVFSYHVGGFGGYSSPSPNNIKTITLDLTTYGTPKVQTGKSPNVHLLLDIFKALHGSTNISFATTAMIHMPDGGIPIANNYVNMFEHAHTEN